MFIRLNFIFVFFFLDAFCRFENNFNNLAPRNFFFMLFFIMLGLFYSVLAQETGEDSYKAKAIESTQTSLKLRPGYIDAKELLDRSL